MGSFQRIQELEDQVAKLEREKRALAIQVSKLSSLVETVESRNRYLKSRFHVLTRKESDEIFHGLQDALRRCDSQQRIQARGASGPERWYAWGRAIKRLQAYLLLFQIARRQHFIAS